MGRVPIPPLPPGEGRGEGRKALLGTTNPAKLERLRWLLEGLSIETLDPSSLGLLGLDIEEAGATHEENARLKAEAWSQAAGLAALASDGGLVIPSLGDDWLSLHTRRFAGEDANDDARIRRLLELMTPYSGEDRKGVWVESVALAGGGLPTVSWLVEGPAGYILEAPDDAHRIPGFWFFSLWFLPELGKTYAAALDGPEADLDSIGDHWTRLKSKVQDYVTRLSGS